MKNYSLFFTSIFFLYSFFNFHAQVGIGTTNPDASAILDINSTSQGVLAPRMTTAQRLGITAPATGLLVFDTDQGGFFYYNGSVWSSFYSSSNKQTGWVALSDGDFSLTLPGITLAQSINPVNFTNLNLNFSNNVADNIIESYAPSGFGGSDFFDDTTSRITPLAVGDAVELRLQFNAVPDANNSFLVIAIDIGSPSGIVIFQKTVPLLRSAGDVNKISESILLYQLGTFFTNGAAIKIGYATASGSPGNVALSNFGLVLTRLHAGS